MERVHRSPIWGTAWLVSEGAGKLITSRPIHSIFPDVVSDLIDWSRGAWVIEVLKQHLWPCDVERVIQVPIGTLTSIDGSYWFFSNHGKFTVMSCYYYILGQALAANTSPSRSSNILSMKEWKWMWGLQTTPKKFELFYGTRVTTSFQLKSHWFIEIWEEIPSVRSARWASKPHLIIFLNVNQWCVYGGSHHLLYDYLRTMQTLLLGSDCLGVGWRKKRWHWQVIYASGCGGLETRWFMGRMVE